MRTPPSTTCGERFWGNNSSAGSMLPALFSVSKQLADRHTGGMDSHHADPHRRPADGYHTQGHGSGGDHPQRKNACRDQANAYHTHGEITNCNDTYCQSILRRIPVPAKADRYQRQAKEPYLTGVSVIRPTVAPVIADQCVYFLFQPRGNRSVFISLLRFLHIIFHQIIHADAEYL